MAPDRITPLIVIPVRGGSVGIPNKATRPLGGVPPLVRTVQTCLPLGDVVVATDAIEIAAIATHFGAQAAMETAPTHGHQTVDKVIWELVGGIPWPALPVATVQCTSPFLSGATIRRCLEMVTGGDCDTAITVRDERHVSWTGPLRAPVLETPWAVRQALPPRWTLTGGCVATTRQHITPSRRFGGRLQLVEVAGAEAVDLDAPADWAVAEWYAGAVSSREALMARVLSDAPQWRGVVAQLSAWDESPEEGTYRTGEALIAGRVVKPRGAHTHEEAELVVASLDVTGEQDVTIVTSAYHQPRAFLTFLQVLKQAGRERDIRLWNAPAPSRMDKLASEWEKIRTYHARGHVASYDDGLEYLAWRDSLVTV
jgi:CMP-N-acetylneuraminic acid synthetase